MRFGRQHPTRDLAAIVLLFSGFSGLAFAFYLLTSNWLGLLLPVAFVIGAWSALRGEVREIELRGDTLMVRTFFRGYPIPRAHVTRVVRTAESASIDVLNGARYDVTPDGEDPVAVAAALEEWLAADGEPETLNAER